MKKSGIEDLLPNTTLVLNSIEEGIYVTDDEGIIIYANPTAGRILGYDVDELFGQVAHDLLRHSRKDGSHLAREECNHHHLLTSGESVDVLDDVFWKKDGTSVPVEYTSTTIHQHGRLLGIVVAFKDITRRKLVESRLLNQNKVLEMIATGESLMNILQFLAVAVEQHTKGVCSIQLMDRDSSLLRFAVGPSLSEESIEVLREVPLHPDACPCSLAAYSRKPVRVPDLLTHPEWSVRRSAEFPLVSTGCYCTPILSVEQAVLGTFAIYFPEGDGLRDEDVSVLESYARLAGIAIGRERAEHYIEYLAFHDSLTGLCNRRYFIARAQSALEQARPHGEPLAVMLYDLDGFKSINDSLGHNLGDLVLKAVAERLQTRLAPSHTLARMGGDEFLILFENAPSQTRLVEEAQRLLQGLEEVLEVDGREFRLTGSAGVAVFPEDGEDLDTLIRHADRAMYYAKDMGGNGVRLYGHMKTNQFSRRFMFESELRQALAAEQFYMEFQPKVSLDSGRVTGAEALIRWNHPQFGVVSPADFIPVAEETGLIHQLDDFVLKTACKQVQAWRERGLIPVPVAVNLSAVRFQETDLVASIRSLLDSEGVAATWLELEITETTLMKNKQEAMTKLRLLREMGIHVAIDDFGVGYSCLALLQHLVVDSLKVDQAFLRDMNEKNAAIVSTIIQLGHSLNLKVVAEGVETVEQRNFVHQAGCDELQGFLFGRPVSATEFEQYLTTSPSSSSQRM